MVFNIKYFLKYNLHVGHSALNSLMLSSWFFFKLKKRIWIINIFKTIIFLKIIFKFLNFLVNNEFPFWFINFEYTKRYIFKINAEACGEFACTQKWVRGFLSNFKSIQKAVKNYTWKSIAYRKSALKTFLIKNWVFTRLTWPRGIFLSNIPLNYVICKEANDIILPIVAMVDTNIKSYLFNYPIPSNDDSLEGICYIVNILSRHILVCKYKKVILWYNKYKINQVKYFNLLKKFVNDKTSKKKELIFSKIFNNVTFSKLLNIRLFNNFTIIKDSLEMIFTGAHIGLDDDSCLSKSALRKLNYLRKFNNNMFFLNNFIKRNKTEFNPLILLQKTTKLNRVSSKKRKRKSYFNYLFLINLIKKTRLFHDSFILNKPSDYYFFNYFKKSKIWTKAHIKVHKNWCFFRNYKMKLNEKHKKKWLNNKFHKRLLQDEKALKWTYFSDAALVLNPDRWVSSRKLYDIMRKLKHTILQYWLIPFIKRFSIKKDYYWFHSKYFFKEDNQFKQTINWKLSKKKAPISTLNYYSNWFFNLLNLPFNKRRFKLKKKIKIKSFVI